MSLYLYQPISISNGKTYQISFDYSNDATPRTMYAGFSEPNDIASEVDVLSLSNAVYNTFAVGANASGTRTFNLTANTGQDTFFITSDLSNIGTITIDNVSVKKIITTVIYDSGILSNTDFITTAGYTRNMRAGFLTSAGNDGKLQYRYVYPNGTVRWLDLKTGLTNVHLSFDTNFFDTNNVTFPTHENKRLLLWVDGSNNVFEWNGAVITFASATANTITKQGTTTWAQEGFNALRDKKVVIGGTTYTYTGGETTTTLTGVTPDPTGGGGHTAGDIIHQAVVTTALSAMSGIQVDFAPTVIGSGRNNQLYLGSSGSNMLYISVVNDYHDYTFSLPTRLVGEGFVLPMDAPAVKFIAQEVHGDGQAYDMWISTGTDRWAIIRSTIQNNFDSSGVPTASSEQLEFLRLKSGPLQGALSERLCAKMKNHIIFVSHDKVCNAMGYISYQFVPVMQDLSYPIIADMNSYDFTDGQIFFHKNYLYIAVPKSGVVRIYNMTDQTQEQYSQYSPEEAVSSAKPWFWEAPITYPISGFYVVDGELYGHGYNTSESYKLFDGDSFNNQDIEANATLAFDDKGDRTQSKGSNEIWVEGYIKQNTDLSVTVTGDLDACATSQTKVINGNDNTIVCFGSGGGAFGKNPLGSQPLGGSSPSQSLPAWFHVAKTYPQVPFYLEQISFYSKGISLQWELVTWGTNARMTTEGNNSITQ